MRVVYVDVLFFINLSINYLLLILTSKLGGVYTSRLKMLAGAALGALLAVCLYFPPIGFGLSLLLKIVLCFSIIAVAFPKEKPKAWLKTGIIFTVISFILAGGVMAMALITKTPHVFSSNGVFYIDISLKLLFVATAVIYCLLSFVMGSKSLPVNNINQEIVISNQGKSVKLKAFTDTGNMAREPISGKRIILVSKDSLWDIFSEAEQAVLMSLTAENQLSCFENLVKICPKKYRLAPCSTVSSSAGAILITLKPDKVMINGKEEKHFLIGILPTAIALADGSRAIIGA